MRKKIIKNLLAESDEKLNTIIMENEQLKERLKNAEDAANTNSDAYIQREEKIQNLEEENSSLNEKLYAVTAEKDSLILEYEQQINDLRAALNDLKGEHYDTQKYADELKTRLQSALSPENTKVADNIDTVEMPTMPPKIGKIEDIREKDSEIFDYASTIISRAVMENAKIKGKIEASGDNNATELVTLATGKTEMLKSDILQTVLSNMNIDAKKQRMDKILSETTDYFDGLIGQLTV